MYVHDIYFAVISFRIELANSQESNGQQNPLTNGAEIKVHLHIYMLYVCICAFIATPFSYA